MDPRDLTKIRRQAQMGGTFGCEVVTELLNLVDEQDSEIVELLYLTKNRLDVMIQKEQNEGVDEEEYKWLVRAKAIVKEMTFDEPNKESTRPDETTGTAEQG